MQTGKRLIAFFCLALAAVIPTAVVFSQTHEYSYINYDIRDGLAGSNVYDITQDKDGFIWFATENGLSRFDGKNFKNFTVQDGLPDNEVLKVFTDSKNRTWVLPFKNSVCYYYKGKIYNPSNDTSLNKLKFIANPFHITEDRYGNVLISESRSYHIVYADKKTESVSAINGTPFLLGPAGLDKNHELRLYTLLGDYTVYAFYNPVKKNISQPYLLGNATMRTKTILRPDCDIVPAKNGSLDITFDGETFNIPEAEQSANLDYLSNQTLAMSMSTGVYLYDLKQKRKLAYVLDKYAVNTAFYDKEANYWFATKDAGVIMIPSLEFKSIILKQEKIQLSVFSIAGIGNKIIVGSNNNAVWELETPSRFKLLPFSFPGPIASGRVLSIVPLDKNRFVAGGDAGIANVYPDNKLLYTSNEYKSWFSNSVKSISTSGNKIVVVTSDFTYEADISNNTGNRLWNNRATCALTADSGYYFGTINGLFFISQSGDTTNFGKKEKSLSARIVSLSASPDGVIWIATKGQGLVALKNNSIITTITSSQGLTSNNCTSLFVDNKPGQNKIWLGTDQGLNVIEKNEKGWGVKLKYTMTDGLLSDIINAIYVTDSMVYAGSPKGITFFNPDKIAAGSACSFRITGIYISDKYWSYDSSGFSLPHRDNDIRFDFSGISLKSGGEINYIYRLKGLHNDWRTTAENQLSFPTLPSGTYTLQIKAVNKYGIESELKEVSFTIQKIFWEKTGFRLLVLLALLLAVWAFIRFRLRYLKQKERERAEVKKQITYLEQTALRSQMNPHFIFNSLNSIQQYVADRDITGANKFITDFSRLIRMTLDLSTHDVISLSEELLYIDTYLRLERTRLENQFDYSFSVQPGIDTKDFVIPPLLLQPFVENSIRHGIKYLPEKNGLIKVSVSRLSHAIRISIEDNGVGRVASRQYKSSYHVQYQSKGITISTGRIEMMNKAADKKINISIHDLMSETGTAAGTRVDIDILIK